MAGLMREPGQMQPQQGGMQPQMSASERNPMNDPNAEEGSNVSPEEQKHYDRVVTNGMKLMYNKQAMPQLLESIKGGGNPVAGLSNTLVAVFSRLEDSAKKANQPIMDEVKQHAATELMEQMVELAEAAGIHEYTPDEMESAYFQALDMYRQAKQETGELPVDELEQDMQMLMQADQQGRLAEIVPGIEEFAQRAPAEEQPPSKPATFGTRG